MSLLSSHVIQIHKVTCKVQFGQSVIVQIRYIKLGTDITTVISDSHELRLSALDSPSATYALSEQGTSLSQRKSVTYGSATRGPTDFILRPAAIFVNTLNVTR
jgi:hypothetical protein